LLLGRKVRDVWFIKQRKIERQMNRKGGRGRLQDYISCLARRRNSPVIGMDTKTEKTFEVDGWIKTRWCDSDSDRKWVEVEVGR
jgi:hypothetical protein